MKNINEDNIVFINGKAYEIVKFNSKLTNKSMTLTGLMIGTEGYIAVGKGYRIYNSKSGKPIVQSRFLEIYEAIQFAEWIYTVYKDYLVIWEDYPKANIIKWCRYAVEGGLILDRMIEILNDKSDIDNKDVSLAWNTARQEQEQIPELLAAN